ncbi:hypothetical protein VTN02DRAFT_4832 [Thermoascus thermophilus]
MPSSLPPGFVDITSAKSSQGYVNIIGVVVDLLPKSRSAGSSFLITFTIKDSDFDVDPWKGLKIKYFNDAERCLPDVRVGDVILLRSVRVRPFRGFPVGVASQGYKVPWVIFRQGQGSQTGVSPICGPESDEPSLQETAYANSLLNRKLGIHSAQPSPVQSARFSTPVTAVSASRSSRPSSTKRDRFSLLKDITPHTFADLVVQVVKTFPEGGRYILYVTDYTTNKALFDYTLHNDEDYPREGDTFNYLSRPKRNTWPGPYGQMTLQVTLWEPHASFAQQNVREDDIVHLSNVHIKLARDSDRIEASIHTDRLYSNKIHVSVIDGFDDPRITELLKRKREYWKKIRGDDTRLGKDAGTSQNGANGSKKNAKKKRAEQQRKNKETKIEEGQTEIVRSVQVKRNEPNRNIAAMDPAIPCRSLADILANESHNNALPGGVEYRLPFQNLRYRATVRVVDFFPPKLEDFAVPYNPEYAMLSGSESDEEDEEDTMMNGRHRRRLWEWRFCLLVEDGTPPPRGQPRERVKLFVSGPDAEFLLKLTAVNLRQNERTLHQLREKLFILWGDLEEKKNTHPGGKLDPQSLENPSGRPFTCCIKEYGVKCEGDHDPDAMTDDDPSSCGNEDCLGWERRFAMFGTTINL